VSTTSASYKAGDVLFEEGSAAHNVFIINSGHVRIERKVFEERILVETLGRGNVCGDIAFAHGATYPVTAVASDDVDVVVVHRDNIEAVMLASPKVVARLASRLAARLTHAHFRLANFALRDSEARVMLQLRHEAERNAGTSGDGYTPIPYDLPQALATEKGRVDGCLRGLVAANLIELDGGGGFRIPDLASYDRKLRYLELADRFE
jgi:CRP-like cAMP-binding protein